jgi:hypothetical protein
VDARYQGVTFGIGILAGLKIPKGSESFTIEAGYMDPNVYNPTFELPPGNQAYSLNSDCFIFSAGYCNLFADGSGQMLSLWAFFHDPIVFGGAPNYEFGPSFDFDYQLQNPKSFSLNAGAQVFLENQVSPLILVGLFNFAYGPMGPEAHDSRGPRLYADPSYALGEVTVQGQLHYVFANDYSESDAGYDGGGWLLGIGPNWKIPLGNGSDLTLSGSYTKIIWGKAAYTGSGNRADLLYNLWRLGLDYHLPL